MYLTAVGYGMIETGIAINGGDDVPDYTNLVFAGGVLTTLFWVCTDTYYVHDNKTSIISKVYCYVF